LAREQSAFQVRQIYVTRPFVIDNFRLHVNALSLYEKKQLMIKQMSCVEVKVLGDRHGGLAVEINDRK